MFYFCSESMPCYKLNVIKLKLNNIKGIITNIPDSIKGSIAVTWDLTCDSTFVTTVGYHQPFVSKWFLRFDLNYLVLISQVLSTYAPAKTGDYADYQTASPSAATLGKRQMFFVRVIMVFMFCLLF